MSDMGDRYRKAFADFGLRPISLLDPGLKGCTGKAGLGICIKCDRLHMPGQSIKPAAKRGASGVYECAEQVIDGKHVTSVLPSNAGDTP